MTLVLPILPARSLLAAALGVCALLICAPVHAGEKAAYYGQIGLGGRFGGAGASDVLFEGAFAATSARLNGALAVAEIHADQDAREVFLREGFFEYHKDCAPGRFRAGRGRKKMGWEYEYPASTRLGVQRTLPYSFLAERSLVGREYFAGFEWLESENCGPGKVPGGFFDSDWVDPRALIEPGHRLGINATFTESNDYTLIAHALFSAGESWRFGAWALGEQRHTRDVHRPLLVWSGTASALFQRGSHRAELEGFVGHDPLASLIEREKANGRGRISFLAAAVKYGFYPGAWNPYLTTSVLKQDSARPGHTLQSLAGIRYFFQAALTLTGEFSFEAARGTGTAINNYSGHLIGRYHF